MNRLLPSCTKKMVPLLALLIVTCSSGRRFDLVDLHQIDPSIQIDMRYSRADNFLHKAVYPANRCLLRRSTAERLRRVQKRLQQQGYGLKIWDGYRPLSVQKEMWIIMPDSRYVADPAKGSRHNRGAAVDVTLVDRRGLEVSMPTPFDEFHERSGSRYSNLAQEVKQHRAILQQAMSGEGFQMIDSEWWHFDDPEWKKCDILDVSIENF